MIEKIQTDKAPQAIGPYSQAVKTRNMVFLSGQIALDPATGNIVGSDVKQQTERIMENLNAVLTAAGTSFDHVVKTTIFLKDLAHFTTVNEVYAKYFGQIPPARATVEVARLPKDVLVEIDAIAVI